jgi:hypothetical protein
MESVLKKYTVTDNTVKYYTMTFSVTRRIVHGEKFLTMHLS